MPVMTSMPLLRRRLAELGRDLLVLDRQERGSISTMVTLVPKRAKIEANSVPTAPAPMTSIDFGTCLSSRMWSELRMRLPSVGAMGRSRGTEPVAMMMFLAP